ncbi:hypothetical protein [Catenulispora subtropica]|uniref:UDP-N-acetyl-alpha-D-muramoyl-L-alanyl-L-glutamat e epimerase n=1 Tax=Catenulispora subtropica TaxID=450798 RepID=A0ABN2RM41_9ACTN
MAEEHYSSPSAPGSPLTARPEFDVVVREFVLDDGPASLHYRVDVGDLTFSSSISYMSIPGWSDVFTVLPVGKNALRLVSALIAWDAMRFLALGGERLVLPPGLPCDATVSAIWRRCFLSQFGEWRYRNGIRYHGRMPELLSPTPPWAEELPGGGATPRTGSRALLANGGGKDSLAGMLILNGSGIDHDVYEGYLPVGGDHELQRRLLDDLRTSAATHHTNVVRVYVHDDFYRRPASVFADAGVKVDHYLTDFAVGHTANYVGYMPIILHGGYDRVWFNIERSADDSHVTWHGEQISHQWCKSKEYQAISAHLFSELTGCNWFKGFDSTLRGLYDHAIYRLVATRPDLLQRTHSCNYGKPWCGHCPKCCFCYLMTSAFLGEDYARRLLGVRESLLADPRNLPVWASLMDSSQVAWECVPSHQEVVTAVDQCLARGIDYPVLRRYAPDPATAARLRARFVDVDWERVPAPITAAVRDLTRNSGVLSQVR